LTVAMPNLVSGKRQKQIRNVQPAVIRLDPAEGGRCTQIKHATNKVSGSKAPFGGIRAEVSGGGSRRLEASFLSSRLIWLVTQTEANK